MSAALILPPGGLTLAGVTDSHLAVYAVVAVVLGYGALAGMAYYLLHDRRPKERPEKREDDRGPGGS